MDDLEITVIIVWALILLLVLFTEITWLGALWLSVFPALGTLQLILKD